MRGSAGSAVVSETTDILIIMLIHHAVSADCTLIGG